MSSCVPRAVGRGLVLLAAISGCRASPADGPGVGGAADAGPDADVAPGAGGPGDGGGDGASDGAVRAPRFTVSGGQIRAEDGRVLVLRGANLAGAQKVAPYLGFQGPEDYARMRAAWGMNSIRFVMPWAAIEPGRGLFDEAYLDEVGRRLDWARDAGLWVILDMHEDLYGEGFAGGDGAPRWSCDEARYAAFQPVTPWFVGMLDKNVIACVDGFWQDPDLASHFAGAWRHVAERFHDHPAVIGFDVLNEPYWGSASLLGFEAHTLQPFYEKMVPIVREQAPGWLAFLEPSASRNLGVRTRLSPFSFGNVVYSPHSYDRSAESGMPFDPARRQVMIDSLRSLRAEADALGAALWIGEYGGNPDNPGVLDYLGAEYEGQTEVTAGAAYWSYDRSQGYGLLNLDGTERSALLDAVARPYPEWVAGEPMGGAFDPASRVYSFTFRPAASGATELSGLGRVYPSGYQVNCPGCQTDVTPDRLAVHAAGSDPVTITLSPP